MKTPRLLSLAAALMLTPLLAASFLATPADSPGPLASSIAAVTVYLDRAVITRTASVELKAGENTVAFENLPVALTEQSLNASARGVAGASILDVGALNVFTEAAPNERVKEYEDEIKAIQKKNRVLDDQSKILEQQRVFVERMLQASTAAASGPAAAASIERAVVARPSLEEWQKLLGYADETFGKIAAEQQKIDNTREELQAARSVSERKLNELRGARGKQSKTVRVRLALTTAGRLEVSIQYAVPNASWTPSYDARLQSADRTVNLSYFGVVRNGTGEDWKDIALTLSTARPSLGGGAPELKPWITQVLTRSLSGNDPLSLLEGAQTASPSRDRALSQTFNNALGASVAPGGGRGGRGNSPAPPPAAEAASVLAAEVEAGVTSATFKIPVPVSITGNNVTQKVGINTTKLMTTLQFQSTPKALEAAFLSAYAINGSEYPLLSGPMNTFFDETFVAQSNLKTVMPGEKFEVALGADDGIKVKRRLVNRFQEDTGLSNKGRRVTYEILIAFTNNKTTVEKLVFKEPTPVSRDEKIKVNVLIPSEKEIGTVASPKEVTREEDGKLVWRVNLEPGKKREFTLKLSVEYPSDIVVSGLE